MSRAFVGWFCMLLAVLVLTALLPGGNVGQASPAIFLVNNAGDAGAGTLRAAIAAANAAAGADTICFNSSMTIQPTTDLPALTDGHTTIDATLAGGGCVASTVELDGSLNTGGPSFDGLVIKGGYEVIRGLVINNFRGNGVVIGGPGGNSLEKNYIGTNRDGTAAKPNVRDGVLLEGKTQEVASWIGGAGVGNLISGNNMNGVHLTTDAHANHVNSNRIGLNKAGMPHDAAVPNVGDGVLIDGAAHSNDVSGNAIAGNSGNGIHVLDLNSDGNTFSSNCIGYRLGDPICQTTSLVGIPNQKDGVLIEGQAKNNTISGDNEAIAANVLNGVEISGAGTNGNTVGPNKRILENTEDGVVIAGGAQSNTVKNDYVSGNHGHGVHITDSGTNKNVVKENCIGRITVPPFVCNVSLANIHDGVAVEGGAQRNVIGPHNVIENNNDDGISISGNQTDFNCVTENSIAYNGGLGIDLNDDGVTSNGPPDNTANDDLDFPIITAASTTLISGTACPGCAVEVFKVALDPSGYGEGRDFLGSATAGPTGDFSLAVSGLVSGERVTATATFTADDPRNTSEFSGNVPAWTLPRPVGGIAELPEIAATEAPDYAVLAGIAAAAALGAITISGGAWYASRRRLR